MKKAYSFLLIFVLIAVTVAGCGDSPPVVHDLSDQNFAMVNQDSNTVQFPGDFEGQYLVVGFIYTHCPDICPITTANMKNVKNELENPSDVHFIDITFDPKRDTPSVLKKYMQSFKLDEDKFTMLTADDATTDSLLKVMDVRAKISHRDTTAQGKVNYFMNHTDRISVLDPEGRIRFEYPGSKVPIKYIIEDLKKIR